MEVHHILLMSLYIRIWVDSPRGDELALVKRRHMHKSNTKEIVDIPTQSLRKFITKEIANIPNRTLRVLRYCITDTNVGTCKA